jgi:hypothetical protein
LLAVLRACRDNCWLVVACGALGRLGMLI